MNATNYDAEYRRNYRRGWRASQGPNHCASLERADERNECNAWYDGYEDYAIGRPSAIATATHVDDEVTS